MRLLTHVITAAEDGLRADTVLRETMRLSGSVLKHVKHIPGGITLDGQNIWTSYLVHTGQTLGVRLGDETNGDALPRPGPLDIVYEDEDIVVLNKPAGVLTHPGPTDIFNTIGNFLTNYYNIQEVPFVFRPVNRLDKPTSGLMVVARHAHAHSLLREQLHTPDFIRRYLAVCDGVPAPEAGVIDLPIGVDDETYLKRQVTPDGAPSRTRYRVLDTSEGRALTALELETGRTHQIRIHMAAIGCPLTGDFLYGTENSAVIDRTALHSAYLSLLHPITGKRLSFTAPLPGDMVRLFPHAPDLPALLAQPSLFRLKPSELCGTMGPIHPSTSTAIQ